MASKRSVVLACSAGVLALAIPSQAQSLDSEWRDAEFYTCAKWQPFCRDSERITECSNKEKRAGGEVGGWGPSATSGRYWGKVCGWRCRMRAHVSL